MGCFALVAGEVFLGVPVHQLGEQCPLISPLNILPLLLFKNEDAFIKRSPVSISHRDSGCLLQQSVTVLDLVMAAEVHFVLVYKIHHRVKRATKNGILLL